MTAFNTWNVNNPVLVKRSLNPQMMRVSHKNKTPAGRKIAKKR